MKCLAIVGDTFGDYNLFRVATLTSQVPQRTAETQLVKDLEKTAASFHLKGQKSPVMTLDDIAKQTMVLDSDCEVRKQKIAKHIDELASVSINMKFLFTKGLTSMFLMLKLKKNPCNYVM